ncbi:hypothetical protein EVAR_57194_1 [Eumeta japonica]|uniref:Uncharacterized protein n=1 Tax=Eumeta variegata TaxID=151549 RepID=A0A4C1Z0N0_EUMVA|nr:hypothetical protein EVAR_57194_1 [Eumeta japonica]
MRALGTIYAAGQSEVTEKTEELHDDEDTDVKQRPPLLHLALHHPAPCPSISLSPFHQISYSYSKGRHSTGFSRGKRTCDPLQIKWCTLPMNTRNPRRVISFGHKFGAGLLGRIKTSDGWKVG